MPCFVGQSKKKRKRRRNRRRGLRLCANFNFTIHQDALYPPVYCIVRLETSGSGATVYLVKIKTLVNTSAHHHHHQITRNLLQT